MKTNLENEYPDHTEAALANGWKPVRQGMNLDEMEDEALFWLSDRYLVTYSDNAVFINTP